MLGRIDLDMKVDICRKLLALPLRFHQEWQRGDVMRRILNDTARAHKAVELLFGDFLMAVLMIIVGVCAAPLHLLEALHGPDPRRARDRAGDLRLRHPHPQEREASPGAVRRRDPAPG